MGGAGGRAGPRQGQSAAIHDARLCQPQILSLPGRSSVMSHLLVHPTAPDAHGFVHKITPASAGWTYVGFAALELQPGQSVARETEGDEVCLVILSGRARITAGDQDFGVLGERTSVF